ncbi:hypothetical protein SUGI_1016770 [Cryptomeria japonica]|uniref:uncharacterized protein LOC131055453 n=1 Tax=Cryptomeria japonica TaxID=3369 RepID=UPI00241475BC|nr:uncharacterized protein LOC131055453 [Cryptomeria japonica]GLJ48149.1 hypothetical protein SUGI_1016770 [Cryptomeria japonica]
MRIPPPTREEENPCFICRNNVNIMDDSMYIRMVQHLIEKCLLFNMDRHECVQTLAKRAHIHPLITLAVWNGLLRENRDFFRTYFIGRSQIYNAQIHSRDPTYYMRHCRRK